MPSPLDAMEAAFEPEGATAPTASTYVGEGFQQQIGAYKLLEKIGEGGFGVIYMAEQAAPVRRRVALKIIKPGMDTREVKRPPARLRTLTSAPVGVGTPSVATCLGITNPICTCESALSFSMNTGVVMEIF
jgi:serine/threonine protein kinase